MLPPIVGVGIVAGNVINSLPESVRVVLDLAALAILFAGFLVLGRLKAQVAASEGAAQAWREERDALVIKVERLATENADLRIEKAQLEARPSLESLEEQMRKLTTLVTQTMEVVKTVPGE